MELKYKEFETLKEFGVDERYASFCDHTVLRAYTTTPVIREFCDEAKRVGAASVCVNPVHVALVHKELEGTGIKTATVVGFHLVRIKLR